MSVTLTLSETVAKRLATVAEREVAAIGQRLIDQGSAGLGGILFELREVMELVTALQAAGLKAAAPTVSESATVAAPVAAAPRAPRRPAPKPPAAEPEDGDDAPHPAVLQARSLPAAASLQELMKGEAKSF